MLAKIFLCSYNIYTSVIQLIKKIISGTNNLFEIIIQQERYYVYPLAEKNIQYTNKNFPHESTHLQYRLLMLC